VLDVGGIFARVGALFRREGFDQFDHALGSARADADKGAHARLAADVDRRGFTQFHKDLDEARRERATATVGVNVDRRGFAEWKMAMRDTKQGVSDLHKEFDKASSKGKEFGSIIGKAFGVIKIPALITGVGLLIRAASALAGGGVALTSALAPLRGLLVAYPAILGAAAQGMGVFKLATGGLVRAVGSLEQPLDKTSTAFKKLTPEGQKFAEFIHNDLGPKLLGLRTTAQKGLFPGLEAGVKSAAKNLGVFRGIIGGTARTLGSLARSAGDALGSKAWGADLTRIGRTNELTIRRLGASAGYLADAFRHVLVSAGPFIRWLTQGVRGAAEYADHAAKAGRETGKLGHFFETTKTTMQDVWKIAKNLGEALFNIGRQGTGLGQGILKDLGTAAQHFNQWTRSTQGQNRIAQYFRDIKPPLYETAGLLHDLTNMFFRLGEDRGGGLTNFLSKVRTLLPDVERLIQTTTDALGPKFTDLLTNVVRLFTVFGGASGPLAKMVGLLSTLTGGLVTLLQHIPGLKSASVTIVGFAAAMKLMGAVGNITGITKVVGAWKTLRKAAEEAVAAEKAGKEVTAGQALARNLVESVSGLRGRVSGAWKRFANWLRGSSVAAGAEAGAAEGEAQTAGAAGSKFLNKFKGAFSAFKKWLIGASATAGAEAGAAEAEGQVAGGIGGKFLAKFKAAFTAFKTWLIGESAAAGAEAGAAEATAYNAASGKGLLGRLLGRGRGAAGAAETAAEAAGGAEAGGIGAAALGGGEAAAAGGAEVAGGAALGIGAAPALAVGALALGGGYALGRYIRSHRENIQTRLGNQISGSASSRINQFEATGNQRGLEQAEVQLRQMSGSSPKLAASLKDVLNHVTDINDRWRKWRDFGHDVAGIREGMGPIAKAGRDFAEALNKTTRGWDIGKLAAKNYGLETGKTLGDLVHKNNSLFDILGKTTRAWKDGSKAADVYGQMGRDVGNQLGKTVDKAGGLFDILGKTSKAYKDGVGAGHRYDDVLGGLGSTTGHLIGKTADAITAHHKHGVQMTHTGSLATDLGHNVSGLIGHINDVPGSSGKAGKGLGRLAGNMGGMAQTAVHAGSIVANATNKLLSDFGAHKISYNVSAGNIGKQAASAFREGGVVQFGRPGDRGPDSIPVNWGGMPIIVAPGEKGAVFTDRQQAAVDYALWATYGLGGMDDMFSKLNIPHGMAQGGRVQRFASGGATRMIAKANEIDSHHYPYRWGGGHDANFTPPYDCSGAVSSVLHSANLLGAPMVSGALAHYGKPGPGPVTIFANPVHTYMRILGRYFGTSNSNPGGGAGWFAGSARPGFAVRHVDASGGTVALPKLTGPGGPMHAILGGQDKATVKAANTYLNKQIAKLGSVGGGDWGNFVGGGHGQFGLGALANLWTSQGGPSKYANLMAWVAMAESHGDENAHNRSGATGLWQILGAVVPGNLRNPIVNAKNAIKKFRDAGSHPLSPWYSSQHAGAIPGGWGPHAGGLRVSRGGRIIRAFQRGGNLPGKKSSYNRRELGELWEYFGGPASKVAEAVAIAWRESRGRSRARNVNTNGTIDRGLWQINSVHGSLSTFDPYDNAHNAVDLFHREGFRPWALHGNPLANTDLGAARSAVRGISVTPGGAHTGHVDSGGGWR
jgi:hypothetical protein